METGRLRELRKTKGYTCEQMARGLGIQKAGYSKKERGDVAVSLADAKKISEMLGESIENIFFK